MGTFSGVRYFPFVSVRHRSRRAPEEDPLNSWVYTRFQAWGTRVDRAHVGPLLDRHNLNHPNDVVIDNFRRESGVLPDRNLSKVWGNIGLYGSLPDLIAIWKNY